MGVILNSPFGELFAIGIGVVALVILWAIIALLIGFLFRCNSDEENRVVRVKKSWLNAGIFLVVAGGGLAIIMIPSSGWGLSVLSVFIVVSGTLLTIYSINYLVILKCDHFIIRNFWRKTCEIPYKSVSQCKFMSTGKSIKIYTTVKAYELDRDFLELSLVEIEDLYERIEKNKVKEQ